MKIEKNKIVGIEFTLKDVENTILDTNVGYAPIDYLHGVGTLVSGLEKELEGKQVGETIIIELSPKDAYGNYQEELKQVVPIEEYRHLIAIEEGHIVTLSDGTEGEILEKNETHFVVDSNHPLAGMTLRYEVTVKGIRQARPEELQAGMPLPQYENCSGGQGCC